MKNIAIVTIESFNFGNRLQNYALQEVIKGLGYNVFTLHRHQYKEKPVMYIKHTLQALFQTKGGMFRSFEKNIRYADIIIEKDSYPQGLNDKFDCFVVGSDQVWNPHFYFAAGACDFLRFADKEKRVAYAPSFGVSEIPQEQERDFAEALRGFKYLSVREQSGQNIIEELIGKRVPVVLDPTLLLSQEQWRKVMKKPKCQPQNQYVLVYALGEKNEMFNEAISFYKKKYKVVDIFEKQRNGKEYSVGPAQFLSLIDNAQLILTDSFHCTVFSLILNRPVYAFERVGLEMGSRIGTLYNMLGVKQEDYKLIDIDFEQVNSNIRVLQKPSLDYLREALCSIKDSRGDTQ